MEVELLKTLLVFLANCFWSVVTTINLSPATITTIILPAWTPINPLTGKMKILIPSMGNYSVEQGDHQRLEMWSHEENQQMLVIESQRSTWHSRQGREIQEACKTFYNVQKKFHGSKNIFINANVRLKGTYSFFIVLIWCFWNQNRPSTI